MRNLSGVTRCGCHGWPWYECPDVVPAAWWGIQAWPLFGRADWPPVIRWCYTADPRPLRDLEGILD